MDKHELERVKADVEIIKEAAGFDLPFGWDSVLVNFLLFPGIGLWISAYWFLSDKTHSLVMGIPVCVAILAAFGYLRFKYRKSSGRSAIKRQEHKWNFIELILSFSIIVPYFFWTDRAGVNPLHVGGGILIVLGITHTIAALQLKGKLYWLGGGIPAAVFGIALLIWQTPTAVVLSGSIFMCVIGLSTGSIQAYQLKQVESTNAN